MTLELVLVVPAAFATLAWVERHASHRPALTAFALGLAAWMARKPWSAARAHWRALPEWDFLGFWLHARSAVARLDFYDPASARHLGRTLTMSDEFRREIVDVGFWYPPPSMFLFAPLGWLERRPALLVWFGFSFICLISSIYLLARLRFKEHRALELLVCATLVFACYGSAATLYFAQTTFACLFALLLVLSTRTARSRGAWLAAATFVKPVAAIVLVPFVTERRWRVVASFAVATGIAFLAAGAAFGPSTVLHYFFRTEAGAKPSWIYSEPTNQSLLGFALRALGKECSSLTSCVLQPAFFLPSLVLGLLTLAIGRRRRPAEDTGVLELWLLLGLMIYPVSQVFYSVLTLPTLLLLWQRRETGRGGAWFAVVATTMTLALFSAHDGTRTIFGYLLLWCCLATSMLREKQLDSPATHGSAV